MQTFSNIKILNLWGDSKKRNAEPGDQNVFDITEGVAICVATRSHSLSTPVVSYSNLQGSRKEKYQKLLRGPLRMDWQNITASPQNFLFVHTDNRVEKEFEELGPSIDKMFQVSGAGMISNRDRFAIDENPEALMQRIRDFADSRIHDDEIRDRFNLKDNYTWKLPDVRSKFQSQEVNDKHIVPLSYRPFDNRFVYYHKSIVFNPRIQVMQHLISGRNLAIVTIGQNESKTFNHAFVSRFPCEKKLATHYGSSVVIPLYLYPKRDYADLFSEVETARPNFTQASERLYGLARNDDLGSAEAANSAVMHFVYSILYSQEYRRRYSGPLLAGFPRIPDNPSSSLFKKLSTLGAELTALHLLDASYEAAPWNSPNSKVECPLDNEAVESFGGNKFHVEKVSYSDGVVWVDKLRTSGFKGLREEVWNFRIGGYQVCNKWLKDRQGRDLSEEDIAHFGKIIVALGETIRIMVEIDEVIDAHGGWPNAFITANS